MQSLEEPPSCYIANRIQSYLLEWVITIIPISRTFPLTCGVDLAWGWELVIQNLLHRDGRRCPQILNFPAICSAPPTKCKLSHIINTSVKKCRGLGSWSLLMSVVHSKVQTDFSIRNDKGKDQLELFEVRVKEHFKAGVGKHSVKSQK